ncbi:Xaa-Pro aminopeptidase [Arsenophonus endosymbiont of Bemisia tabaci]|uniref:Xaa-Pro aminopeptidase n=1 Tax=Arsenophonus endosymbiont of Bemisia tabaci TaxID=536059 RepID=UPI0015F47B80|nr:Xaa-Pro aminopeptidase [Arsenophonus endosymbiont of Bemisia tabaci]CAA2930469.1 Xaa-Pro aminopeptidase [Arsenophonus endosymbiont of Bemisia tabaci Q2]
MTQQPFISRRHKFIKKMALTSAGIFFAAPSALRNADCEYPYRQHSDFLYLTGFSEPEAALVIIKYNETSSESILFNRVRDQAMETWFGRRLGQQAAIAKLGVDRALPFAEIDQQLYQLLNGLAAIYHAQGEFAYADQIVGAALNRLRQGSRQKLKAPSTQMDWRPMLHEMRLFKSPEELTLMREASKISADAHLRAMETCQPDMYEYQLAAEIEHQFASQGAKSPAYTTIVGSGQNACILHYTENDALMKAGDLVLVDAGAEYQGYASDITRTFPVNGKFSPPQRKIYDIVLTALNSALTLYRPGVTIHQVMAAVIKIKIEGLIKLGLLQGELNKLIESKAHLPFFMHGLSHWLGLDVHDVGDYGNNHDRPLEPGMVLTVEPGLYIAQDANVPEAYRGIGIRIEDDIMIIEEGNENLTAAVIKDPDKIEALMAAAK